MGSLVRSIGNLFGADSAPKPPGAPPAPPPIPPPLAPPAPPSPTDPTTGAAMSAAGQAAIAGLQNQGGYRPTTLGQGGSLAAQTLLSDDGPGGEQSVYNQSLAARRLLIQAQAPVNDPATAAPAAPKPTRAATAVAKAPNTPAPAPQQNAFDNALSPPGFVRPQQPQLRTPPAGSAFFTPWVSSPRRY